MVTRFHSDSSHTHLVVKRKRGRDGLCSLASLCCALFQGKSCLSIPGIVNWTLFQVLAQEHESAVKKFKVGD